MWDLWWTKWHWHRFYSPITSVFPVNFISPALHYKEKAEKHNHLHHKGCTISLKAAVCLASAAGRFTTKEICVAVSGPREWGRRIDRRNVRVRKHINKYQ
jgi:hypothetical protein